MNTLYHSYISKVYQTLVQLEIEFAFVGGMVVSLYETIDLPITLRHTKDLDCVISIDTRGKYYLFQEKVRSLGFVEDSSDNAPICRWVFQGITIDLMPINEEVLGFSNPWYTHGMQYIIYVQLEDDVEVPVFDFPYFFASKLVAMNQREGGVDLRWNHDFEDILHLLIHRRDAIQELQTSNEDIRNYIKDECRNLFKRPLFLKEAINAHLVYKGYKEEKQQLIFDSIKELAG